MFKEIDVIKDLALKYSKPQLGRMAQLGMIEPQKAMMAGMMRDRIAKEDAKPPTATVAQDVLGLQPPQQQPQPQQMGMPQMAQAQGQPQEAPQPQMGMPQSEQPPMGPTQMAATGGLTSISIESQDYAGGGIVAFAGEEESLVRDNFAAQRPSLLFNFDSGKTQSAGEDPAMLQQQLAQAESRLAQTPPGAAKVLSPSWQSPMRSRAAASSIWRRPMPSCIRFGVIYGRRSPRSGRSTSGHFWVAANTPLGWMISSVPRPSASSP